MTYKKPLIWVIILVFILLIGFSIYFFTKSSDKNDMDENEEFNFERDAEKAVPENIIMQTCDIIEALDTDSKEVKLSDTIYSSIVEEWENWKSLDTAARVMAAHYPGNETKFFESWDDAVGYIGIVPWNPFENVDWLEKRNYAGADIKDFDTGVLNHCCFNVNGNSDGDIGYASLQTGYAIGKIRVVMVDYIYANNYLDTIIDQYTMTKYYKLYKENGSILAHECVSTDQDYNCIVGVLKSEKAISIRMKFYKNDEIKYEIYMVSLEDLEKLEDPFNKVCAELSIPFEYVTVLQENAEKNESEENVDENTVYVPKTVIDMIPIETDLDGSHNGFFVVTIDGRKYRYKMASAQNDSVTVGDMVYKWEDTSDIYKFYEVKEYPDLRCLKCTHTENGVDHDFLVAYAPPSGLPDGSLEEIINDGFVVMKNGSVISGEDKWQEFVKKTEAREPAEINIADYYTLTGRMAKNLYELSNIDYPMAYLHRLKYDGEYFIFTPLQKSDASDNKYEIMPDNENEWEQKYKYMKHYTEKAPSDTALYTTFDKYVLVDDDSVTWDDIWNATIGLTEGFWHAEVFNKYDYKEGVDPEELTTMDLDY